MNVPHISIVVPVFNGADHIGDCLASLCALDYPEAKREIIVVDNNSTDGTRAIIDRFPVVCLEEKTPGAAAARNKGIAAAKSDIIAFTDADCIVDSRWTREIKMAFEQKSVDAVIGFADGVNANLFAEMAQKRWESFWFTKSEAGYVLNRSGIDTRNCALRKEALLRVGRFNSRLLHCEDLELSMRLNRAGCKIIGVPSMRVLHHNPTTVEVALKKGRERMATILELRRNPPEDFSASDLPMPSSAFFGIADRELKGPMLSITIAILSVLSAATLLVFRMLLAIRIGGFLTFKIYKIFHGIGYDLAILQDRMAQR